ncbi:MAG: 30S ribosomal protein S7 [Caldiserica bacterium CG02_land_8_20_14_3_00_36_38]|jgi:small subunit ribosomal protein S7|nr:30S ribosomal protein S7 [Caldisericota bacterium]OIP12914.1 MAG: 30S ribosomal protein S7 [Caldisericum sp. CG2_30_36_11]PIP49539.1 MAG: 30S ribosomal protein S7 [Caldiserica bacterium CG23_combo_of_CG06-09_8_20_14_all_35_60]PIV56104.1 MAG: 30S ribosomal protein S7 [Caldiserica bacterium CG02_land_8_20_14_3_00_36_38]PIX28784.1 MAG: 30S ribosomal protein S7 [Caldiserica bacterium CG_4_8_14_3_um_filter_35_18]
MPRKGPVPKREILPDPVYRSVLVAKLINNLMEGGSKSVAEKIVYKSFEIVKEKAKKDPIEVFELAVEKVRPLVEVKPRRVGGATYQIPIEMDKDRGQKVALKWIIKAARGKKGKPMTEKLSEEIIDASNEAGVAYKKKMDVHKMAEANRSYSHLRW